MSREKETFYLVYSKPGVSKLRPALSFFFGPRLILKMQCDMARQPLYKMEPCKNNNIILGFKKFVKQTTVSRIVNSAFSCEVDRCHAKDSSECVCKTHAQTHRPLLFGAIITFLLFSVNSQFFQFVARYKQKIKNNFAAIIFLYIQPENAVQSMC